MEKYRYQKTGRMLEDSDPLIMKVWVTQVGKSFREAEVLTDGKGSMEWALEEDSHRHQLSTVVSWSVTEQGLHLIYIFSPHL